MAGAHRLLVSMSCEAGTPHWTLTTAVLLSLLLGIVSAYPLPSGRTNGTLLLEKRWETLFSRSVLGISGEKPELNWESDYLLGIKRIRRLYCNVGIGFHLQILPDGTINGVHHENQYNSLPRRVQVPRADAPQQLQRLRVAGVQRLLRGAQQARPRQEGQQGHHCHDCDAFPTPNITSPEQRLAITH
ncbi:fibroblast growth factor 6-like isoform 2-T2 [Syngnathus typhle]